MKHRLTAAGLLIMATMLGACGRTAPSEEVTVSSTSSSTTTSTAQVTTTTTVQISEVTYVIQSGDSLSIIAERFGVSTDELADFNAIGDVNDIKVGQELRIPPAATVPSSTTTAPAEQTSTSS